MTTNESNLLLIKPTDTVETVVAQIARTTDPIIQLLITEGTTLLHNPEHCQALQQAAHQHQHTLLVITSDPQTLTNARQHAMETIIVEGARVTPDAPTATDTPAAVTDTRAPAPDYDEDDPFADLDNLSDIMAGSPPPHQTTPPPRTERIRAEDIELTEEEKDRAAGGAKRKAASTPMPFPIPLHFVIPIVVALLLVVAALAFLVLTKTTVTVAPPQLQTHTITEQPIPIIVPGAPPAENTTAIQALSLTTTATYTSTGEVLKETTAPDAYASGSLILLNESFQSITLPAGTEFVGTNEQGQEVRFVSDTAITIPGASTTRQGYQIITTIGRTSAPVTARTPGSNANIPANTITQFIIPGQSPVSFNAGTLLIEHGPITGGTEKPIRVVKDEDIHATLGPALTNLFSNARQQLQQQAAAQQLLLAPQTIWPNQQTLSQGSGYELTIDPPIGQPVSNPANPMFTLVVRSTFSALATPPDQTLDAQLQTALPTLLRNQGTIKPGHQLTPNIETIEWDGARLAVSGTLRPANQTNTLSPATRTAIRNAIKGKNRNQAQQALENFKQQGIISAYTLPPDKKKIPAWDFQLTLRVQKPQP